MTNDHIVEILDKSKVYQNSDGSIYWLKTISTFPFLMLNQDGNKIYDKTPSKNVQIHVSPSDLGYTKTFKKTVYVRKKLSSDQTISDPYIFFELPVEFFVPEGDPRYKYLYITTVRSGRVYFVDVDSLITYEANINEKSFCRHGKAKRLPDDYLLARNALIYEQNPANELELFLPEPM